MRFKCLFVLIALVLFFNSESIAQECDCPYPIIFVHGINSSADTWSDMMDVLEPIYGTSQILHFDLNASKTSTKHIDDVKWHTFFVEDTCLYRINFDTNYSIFDLGQSYSNESAIVKQGYAMKLAIDEVLKKTNKDKVILVAHSMGGLASRDYLQRWALDGESKVAKLFTMGTPHLGANIAQFAPIGVLAPNRASEASRDMATTVNRNGAIPGIYLFGGDESPIFWQITGPPLAFHNTDVNCNGISSEYVIGINQGTKDNSFLPLPTDVKYTYFVGNQNEICAPSTNYFGCLGDGLVDDMQQWLYTGGDGSTYDFINGLSIPEPSDGVANRLSDRLTRFIEISILHPIAHSLETGLVDQVARGLDEADFPYFAHEIIDEKWYIGLSQIRADQTATNSNKIINNSVNAHYKIDSDWYKVEIENYAKSLQIEFKSNNNYDAYIEILTNSSPDSYSNNGFISEELPVPKSNTQQSNYLNVCDVFPGVYYIRITHDLRTGLDPNVGWRTPYKFKVSTTNFDIATISPDCTNGISNTFYTMSFSGDPTHNYSVVATNQMTYEVEQNLLASPGNDIIFAFDNSVGQIEYVLTDLITGCTVTMNAPIINCTDPLPTCNLVDGSLDISEINCDLNTFSLVFDGTSMGSGSGFTATVNGVSHAVIPGPSNTLQFVEGSSQLDVMIIGSGCTSLSDIEATGCPDPTPPPPTSSCGINGDVFNLYWPFQDSYWDTKNGYNVTCGNGCGFHLGSDYYSQDWSRTSACNENVYSPLTGTVLYVYENCPSSTNCALTHVCDDGNTPYGNTIIIELTDNNYAFRISHFNEVLVAEGDPIKPGQLLGRIGATGTNTAISGKHAHCTMYKNINDEISPGVTFKSRLEIGITNLITINPSFGKANFAQDFEFDCFNTIQDLSFLSSGSCFSPNSDIPISFRELGTNKDLRIEVCSATGDSDINPGPCVEIVDPFVIDNTQSQDVWNYTFSSNSLTPGNYKIKIYDPLMSANNTVSINSFEINDNCGDVVEVCSAPSFMQSSSVTDDSALLSWSPVNSSNGYRVQIKYSSQDDASWGTLLASHPLVSFELSGSLQSCTGYDFRVASLCDGGITNYVNTSFVTDGCGGPNGGNNGSGGLSGGTSQDISFLGDCPGDNDDDEDPVFLNCPTERLNFTVDNADMCGTYINWSVPVAVDNCNVTVTKLSGPDPGDFKQVGNYTVTYQAEDNNNNIAICTINITVHDGLALQWVNCPTAPLVFGTNPDICGVYANWAIPVAVDDCNVTVTQRSNGAPSPGDLLEPGTYNIIYDAVNNANPPQTITCSFFVQVNETQNPELNCPQDITVANDLGVCEAEVPNIQLEFAFDNCPYTVTWTSSPTDVTGTGTSASDDASGAIFPVGVTTVTYTITENDDNGNGIAMSSCDIIVTVVDEEPPMITCPADAEIGTSMGGIGDCLAEYTWAHPTPTDNCGVTAYTITYTYPDGSVVGPIALLGMEGASITRIFDLGLTAMLYHVEDLEGNITECTFTVLVEDDEDPIIFCEEVVATNVYTYDSPLNIEPNDVTTATIIVAPDMDITDLNILSLVGTQPDMGALTVTLTSPQGTLVTLFDGLCTATSDFDMMLDDAAAANITTAACSPLGAGMMHISQDALAAFNGERSAGDWVLTFTNTHLGVCGVLTDWQLQIIGNDNGPDGNKLQVIADSGTCTYMMYGTDFDPRYTDNCDGPFTLQTLITGPFDNTLQGSELPIGESLVTWTVFDLAGNTSSCDLIIEVLDTEAPTFTNCTKDDIVQNSETGICGANVTFAVPVAIDNCGDVVVTQIDASGMTTGSVFPVGMTIMTWEAVDPSGNKETCTMRVIVNDTQEPQFGCPEDVLENMDPWLCSAVVQNIAPTVVLDNCQDNIAITYQIEHPQGSGDIVAGGVINASGEEFLPGISEVTYKLSDQPLLLITEVTHEIGITNGGMNPEPYTVLTTDDFVEITNLGAASINVSGLMIERLGVIPAEVITIPDNTIIGVGTTIVIHFGNGADDIASLFFNVPCAVDMSTSTATAYVMSFKGRVLDVVSVNGYAPIGQGTVAIVTSDDWTDNVATMNGKGGIIRQYSFDSNTAVDWIVADVCTPITIGLVNTALDIMPDNGTTTAFQSIDANMITCSFTVEIVDQELPFCGEFGEHIYNGATQLGVPNSIIGGTILQSIITVDDDFVIGDVDLLDIYGLHSDISELTFKITSPEGTQVILFDGLCATTDNFDFGLDSDTLISIGTAPCSPLGGGGMFAPFNSLCLVNDAFYGENAMGEWIFEIADTVAANSGQLNNWNLRLWEIAAYSQMDTIYGNDSGKCGADFTWVHPRIIDNCKEGTVELKYLTNDDITLPFSPGIIVQADTLTEYFEVGVTTVRYILTDGDGNIDSCDFDVTILDIENPFVVCPADISIALAGGECRVRVCYEPLLTSDNCSVVDTVYSIEPCSYFEIGTTPVTIYIYDPAGNIDSCIFDIEVIGFNPLTTELSCNDLINFSLGSDCEEEILPDMVLEGNNYRCYEDYIVILTYPNGDTLTTSPYITVANVDQTITVTVFDPLTGNSCWSQLNIEEKQIPTIRCPKDTVIYCNSDPNLRDENGLLYTGELELLSCENSYIIKYEDTFTDNGKCGDPRASISRVWILTDDDGHEVSCTQIIDVLPYDNSQIVWPQDISLDHALNCSDVSINQLLISPDSTGFPTINGYNVDNAGAFCNLSHTYSDEIYWICDGSYEIYRTWKVRNRCLPFSQTNPVIYGQLIEILDNEGPIVYPCPDDITISVDAWDCAGSTALPIPGKLKDLCSTFEFEFDIYGSGFIEKTGSIADGDLALFAYNINKGTSALIRYTFIDACANSTKCEFNVTVNDATPPVVVVKKNIVVSLTSSATSEDGYAKIYTDAIDNGSYDGCSPNVKLEIRRDSDICGVKGNATYNADGHPQDGSPLVDTDGGAYVKFCCADIANATVDVDGDGVMDA